MNVLIVEDEHLAAEKLAGMLREIDPAIHIAAYLPSVEASIAWLHSNTPDLIFLDIQLSDGLSFAIFDAIEVRTPIIFTTAYDEYAIRAFKVNSIDYLLKPVRKDELQASIRKYSQLKAAHSFDFKDIIKSFRSEEPGYKQRFLIQYGQKIRKVEMRDVAYFYAMEKDVFLVTFQKDTLPVDFTLDRLEEVIDPATFFRINRKMLISFKSIRSMVPYSRSRIRIDLEPPEPKSVEALVSVERAGAFKAWMDK